MASFALKNVWYQGTLSPSMPPTSLSERGLTIGGESTSGRVLLSHRSSTSQTGRTSAGSSRAWRKLERKQGLSWLDLSKPALQASSYRAGKKLFAVPPRLREVPVRDRDIREQEYVGNGDRSSKQLPQVRNKETQDLVEDIVEGDGAQKDEDWLKNFPDRYKTMLATSLAFVICNMDKVNMSVAIIPMSHQLGWNASTAGLVQSSFFWGYALSQLPGGWLAKKFTGKRVLRAGVLAWSLATAAVPTVATVMPALLSSRLLVGLGEGVSPSAATELIARTMPATERSRAVAFVFGGLNVGSVAGLLLAPHIIESYGWESVFYIFGVLGIFWCFASDSSTNEVDGSHAGGNGTASSGPKELAASEVSLAKPSEPDDEPIPWKEILKSPPIWAMIYAHFCGNWGHYTLLSWLPTYFSEELNLDLSHAAAVSILPSLCSVGFSTLAARFADKLISEGTDVTLVRKVCQSIAFISPAACMAFTCLNPHIPPWGVVGVLTAGIGLSSVALAGLYCTHQDISPKYASVLLGITSTVGAIPGVLGVALVGYLFDETKSWNLALFAPSIFFYVTGAIVWNLLASSKPQSFNTVSSGAKVE